MPRTILPGPFCPTEVQKRETFTAKLEHIVIKLISFANSEAQDSVSFHKHETGHTVKKKERTRH